jgi:hypothetical protein
MKNPWIRSALVATTLAATSVLPAAPALAESVTIADGTSDAWEQHQDPETGEITYTEAGSPMNSDVTKVVAKHTARTVVIRTYFQNLRNNELGVVVGAKIRTNEGVKRLALALKEDGRRADAVLLGRTSAVRCQGLRQDIDWAGDRVDLAVPRACLSKPRWVQVVVSAGNYGSSGGHSYVDVAGKAGHGFTGWSDKIRRG